ncbi:cytochrome P450 [Streptomyces cinnamoneus]|uniref:cytochrome P450 n=1 Tax=Streptomyces cinnamoneus TaxID=53446 RepID=UPI003424EA72
MAPGGFPLLGHIPRLARAPLAFFERLNGQGSVVRIRIGRRVGYVVTRPDLVRRVLINDQRYYDKGGPIYDKLRIVAGNGLATCPASEHRKQRLLMQPAFHASRFPGYLAIMRDVVAEVTGAWRSGQVVDLEVEMRRIVALVTARALISADHGVEAVERWADSLPETLQMLYWRIVVPGEALHKLLPASRRLDRNLTHMQAAADRVVAQYRASGADYGDLLSVIVHAWGQEPDQRSADRDVHGQVSNILIGGIETTAHALTWAFRLLSRSPDSTARLVAELDEVLNGRLPEYADLPRLPYAQRMFTETLRLYPPAWLVSRTAIEDTELGGYRIPAGSDVFFSPYALHRVSEVFPDPERFDPDRWLPERAGKEQREGFFAFGAGPGKCIGDIFAMTEATLVLAIVLGRWQVNHLPDSPDKPVLRLTLSPPPTRVTVKARQRQSTACQT